MAGDEMASPAPPVVALTNDLLAEIFLRLPTPEDLVRASAACVSFRRLVTDRPFLRRFRSLHAPPFVGFLDHKGFHPALPPHPSAPSARAVSDAADFDLSFLPSSPPGSSWMVRNVRDGRVLVDRDPKPEGGNEGGGEEPSLFTEIAVCDPLRRRFVLLPPIPDDLADSVERPMRVHLERYCEIFLVPRSEEGAAAEADDASFKVIWMAQCRAKLCTFVFSSSTGQWCAGASPSSVDLLTGTGLSSSPSPVFSGRQYACGCFYWGMDWRTKLLVLDTRVMKFSITDLPPGCHRGQTAVVEAGEGMTGMFALQGDIAAGTFSLYYTIRRKERESHPEQWQMEKIIPLDSGYRHYIRGASEKLLLLARFPGSGIGFIPEKPDLECFSLDVKTLQLQRVCGLNYHTLYSHIYTSFPPSLSPEII